MFLEEFFVLPESDKVVIMKDHIGQLGVKPIFIEVLIDLLEVGEERVFF
jgi:hypothetical protein